MSENQGALAYAAYVRAAELHSATPWSELTDKDRKPWVTSADRAKAQHDERHAIEVGELLDTEASAGLMNHGQDDDPITDEYDYSDRAEVAELEAKGL